jgi:hypothetical protein
MRPSLTALLAATALALASCSSYYLASPQPADRSDLRRIPREMRGAWQALQDEETPPDPDAPPNYIADRHTLRIVEADDATVIDRVRTLEEAADTSTGETPAFTREQRRDTATGTVDTVVNLIVRGDRAYPVDDDGIGRGYPYTRSGDTLRFTRRDTAIHELGHHLRIRKADKDLWVLNFRDGERREARGWWMVLIAERRGDRFFLHSASEKMKTHPSLVGQASEKYHFDLDFRAADVRTLLRDSLFTPAVLLVK